MPNYDYLRTSQQAYDFSPIMRGAEVAAELKSRAIQDAAKSIMHGYMQGKQHKFAREEAASDRTFRATEAEKDRGQRSLLADRDLFFSERRAERAALLEDRRDALNREFTDGENAKKIAGELERQKLQNQGDLDEANARINAQNERDARSGKALEMALMFASKGSTMDPRTSISVTGADLSPALRGMGPQDLQSHIGKSRDPDTAKNALKALTTKQDIEFVDAGRLAKIEQMIAEKFGPEAAKFAVGEVYGHLPVGPVAARDKAAQGFSASFKSEFPQADEAQAGADKYNVSGVDVSSLFGGGDYANMSAKQKVAARHLIGNMFENDPEWISAKTALALAPEGVLDAKRQEIEKRIKDDVFQGWANYPPPQPGEAAPPAGAGATEQPKTGNQFGIPEDEFNAIVEAKASGDYETATALMRKYMAPTGGAPVKPPEAPSAGAGDLSDDQRVELAKRAAAGDQNAINYFKWQEQKARMPARKKPEPEAAPAPPPAEELPGSSIEHTALRGLAEKVKDPTSLKRYQTAAENFMRKHGVKSWGVIDKIIGGK